MDGQDALTKPAHIAPTAARRPAAGPTSAAVKLRDPAMVAMIDAAVRAKNAQPPPSPQPAAQPVRTLQPRVDPVKRLIELRERLRLEMEHLRAEADAMQCRISGVQLAIVELGKSEAA